MDRGEARHTHLGSISGFLFDYRPIAFWARVDYLQSSLEDHIGGLNRQVRGLNLAITAIATHEPTDIQTIIKAILARAEEDVKKGEPDGAADSVTQVGLLVRLAKDAKIQLPIDTVRGWEEQIDAIARSSDDTNLLNATKKTSANLAYYTSGPPSPPTTVPK